jgi:pimeloyl-ACP methyl ester carboxylesterase
MAILAFAELYPEEFGSRVIAVVLANTAAGELVKELLGGLGTRLAALATPALRRLLVTNPRPAQRIRARALERRSGLAFLVAEATNFGPDAPPSLIDYVVGLAAEARPEVWTDLAVSLVEMDMTEALENITVPALIVAAERDRLTPLTSARAMERRLPDGRVVVLEASGHVAMLERHAEFNAALRGFLAQTVTSGRQAAQA